MRLRENGRVDTVISHPYIIPKHQQDEWTSEIAGKIEAFGLKLKLKLLPLGYGLKRMLQLGGGTVQPKPVQQFWAQGQKPSCMR